MKQYFNKTILIIFSFFIKRNEIILLQQQQQKRTISIESIDICQQDDKQYETLLPILVEKMMNSEYDAINSTFFNNKKFGHIKDGNIFARIIKSLDPNCPKNEKVPVELEEMLYDIYESLLRVPFFINKKKFITNLLKKLEDPVFDYLFGDSRKIKSDIIKNVLEEKFTFSNFFIDFKELKMDNKPPYFFMGDTSFEFKLPFFTFQKIRTPNEFFATLFEDTLPGFSYFDPRVKNNNGQSVRVRKNIYKVMADVLYETFPLKELMEGLDYNKLNFKKYGEKVYIKDIAEYIFSRTLKQYKKLKKAELLPLEITQILKDERYIIVKNEKNETIKIGPFYKEKDLNEIFEKNHIRTIASNIRRILIDIKKFKGNSDIEEIEVKKDRNIIKLKETMELSIVDTLISGKILERRLIQEEYMSDNLDAIELKIKEIFFKYSYKI